MTRHSLRYTIERSEHNDGRGWQVVARCGIESFAILADALKREGQPCRVWDNDGPATLVYTTR